MKTIKVRELVDFTRMSERSKQTFALKVKTGVDKTESASGGNYWIHSTSAICNSFKLNDISPVVEKRGVLIDKYINSHFPRTKLMFERNIGILDTYADMDSKSWRPSRNLTYKMIPKKTPVVVYNGIGNKVRPDLVFSYSSFGDKPQIGGIWFIPKVGGFKKSELGLFLSVFNMYLTQQYAKQYQINSAYCFAIELVNGSVMSHQELIDYNINPLLEESIHELIKCMV